MASEDSAGSIGVPLDGSKNAENALPYAALLARLYGMPVEFVHVVDHEGVRTAEDLANAGEAFAKYADELAGRWEIADHRSSVSQGPAAELILEKLAGAGFIVIASHGHGGFHAMFVGSVADKVVRGATVPVLLVPGVGAPLVADVRRPVLIGLDGSEAAEKALLAGRDIAAKMGAPVALVRAWTLPVQAMGPYDAYGSYAGNDLYASFEAGAEEYLKLTAAPGEKILIAQGPPAIVIADAAVKLDAGLVVVASSGKGLASRIALGSTTDRLRHSLHRPLLIVRE